MMKKSTDIRTLKAIVTPSRYTIPDTKGLHLWTRNDLKKYWVLRYTFRAKRYDMSLGSFPDLTLSDAKAKVQKLRSQISNDVNPMDVKKEKKESDKNQTARITFKEFALPYIETMSPKWSNSKHASQWENTLNTYAFPVIGNISLEAITTKHIQEILTPIWNTKIETASRVRGRIEKIISAAITSGHRKAANPAIWKGHLENLLPSTRRLDSHHAALPYQEIPVFMQQLMTFNSVSSLALQFTILSALRTGEVIFMNKSEVSENLLTIPASRMKAKREHQVPMCSKSIEIISKASALGSESKYIFSNKGKQLSNMAMLMLLRGFKSGITVHGFRSTFRDWVAEETNHSPEVAEMALAHTIGNKVEAAYRRGKLIERRRILMQDWENYCLSASPTISTQ